MKTFDHIVVGSGISGMTAALLLAKAGGRVLVIEKAAAMGGSMLRFHREGIPFDTGFHVTGGLGENGLLTRMLERLGIAEAITPLFITEDRAQRIIFEATGEAYELPSGIDALRAQFARFFPAERTAIDLYFDKLRAVYQASAELVFEEGDHLGASLCAEDHITLQTVLDGLTQNENLKAMLSIFCMYHGVSPEEVSFAAHSRVCYSLFESLARVERGGDAFVRAFRARFQELGVEVLCNTEITGCGAVDGKTIRSFQLSNGEEIGFGSAVLAIHPRDILALLPCHLVRPAMVNRVNAFEEAAGFFSVFATLDLQDAPDAMDATITSLLPSADMNALMSPGSTEPALGIICNRETTRGRRVHTLTAFEPCFPEEVSAWKESETGQRPAGYQAYKDQRAARILERIQTAYPEYRGHIRLLDSASLLTYRDWLHSPSGSAYGIKQKASQMNLLGKLPATNLFAAGQSALLPGIVGAMMSSFIVCKSLLGTSSYQQPVCS